MPLIAEHAALRRLHSPGQPAGGPASADGPVAAPRPPVLSSLAATLAGRRSVREFADRPVPAELLSSACQTGIEMEQAHWPAAGHGDAGIGVAAAVSDVTGLGRGIYRYVPAWREFALAAGEDLLGELRLGYAAAPALLLVHGDLDKARHTREAGGYQRLLVRAGALGYACLLAALSAGLCGCLYGGASIRVSRSLSAGQDRPHHLFTAAIGWPPDGGKAE